MPSEIVPFKRRLLSFLFCLGLLVPLPARAQQTTPTPTPQSNGQQQTTTAAATAQDDEVVRVNAELVQTDVMVFDKQGRFIEGLQPSQFELRVDGKPQSISFFEMVKAGSLNEDMQLAAARGTRGGNTSAGRPASGTEPVAARPLDRGRSVFFFIDDLHLSAGNLPQTRKVMLNFINEMGQNDEAAISSASGQIGFLQQVTSDKTVLRKALDRLTFRQPSRYDPERPPMSEYHALQIERRDISTLEYFVDEWLKQQPARTPRDTAEAIVRARASNILTQTSYVTQTTLQSLENLVRSIAPLPGRKLLFFISDGFLLNERSSNVHNQLRRVTDAAARSGTVIYSMDARGLITGMTDASDGGAFDPSGRLARASQGEIAASQDGLHALAADTGGRAILNRNKLDTEVKAALKETEVYYLLAWTPEGGRPRGGKFRTIDVKVAGRPDLRVRVRRGYLVEQNLAQKSQGNRTAPVSDKKPSPVAELVAALRSLYTRNDLPTSLFAGYADAPDAGAMLTTLVQIDGATLDFGTDDNKQNARIDLVGIIFDERGKAAATFQQQLTVLPPPPNSTGQRRDITYNQPNRLAPGLYQVRVAARDDKSGRIGSATQWIQIPDTKQGTFSLSSIFISERAPEQATTDAASPAPNMLSVNRRFARTSKLQFILSIYNAVRQTAPPDVALQIQVFRDDQPVITTPLRRVETKDVKDLARIPYAAEFALDGLPTGNYVLKITAIDRTAKASATQHIDFMIE